MKASKIDRYTADALEQWKRERAEVIRTLLKEGRTKQQVADRLQISQEWVRRLAERSNG